LKLTFPNNLRAVSAWLIIGLSLLFPIREPLKAQGSNLPTESRGYDLLDRLFIKSRATPPFHPAIRPYTRSDIGRYSTELDTLPVPWSSRDREDLRYLFNDNNEWLGQAPYATTLFGRRVPVFPDTAVSQIEASLNSEHYEKLTPFLKIFYPSPANFLEVNERFFHLRVNPVVGILGGRDLANERWIGSFPRGLVLRGGLDDRIYFMAEILETQSFLPVYGETFEDRFEAIPGQGLYKFTDRAGPNGLLYDYLNGRGYVGFNVTRHLGVQFGYSRHFIGIGYRSLFLSDFSNNYLFLKLNWRVWRLHYQNLFAELTTQSVNSFPVNQRGPKKWMAAHYLSLEVARGLYIGLFESVIFARDQRFEVQFLNPVILYRTVEQAIGSPDNVSLGFDLSWNFLRHFQLYAQFYLDEFVFNELVTDNRGWWGNKNAFQVGLKYINAFGLDHLDLQAEFNSIRPYTYSFRDSLANYSHQNQSLAHPQGANLREYILLLRWQLSKRLEASGRFVYLESGEDPDGENYGGNILLSSDTRVQEYGNRIGQGIATRTAFVNLLLSYRLFHNGYLDLQYQYYRKDSAEEDLRERFQYLGAGFRLNFFRRKGLF